jgi:hypothetical protein
VRAYCERSESSEEREVKQRAAAPALKAAERVRQHNEGVLNGDSVILGDNDSAADDNG